MLNARISESSFPSHLDTEKERLCSLGCATDCNLNFVKRGGLINLKIETFSLKSASIGQRAEQTGATKTHHRPGFGEKILATGQFL